LPELSGLSLGSMNIGPDCIGSLARMRRLNDVLVPADTWSLQDVLRLKKSLPAKCKLNTAKGCFTND
jgi:hypothetical protein